MIRKYIFFITHAFLNLCSSTYPEFHFRNFKWNAKENALKLGWPKEYWSCSVLVKSAAYHSLRRSSDIYVPSGPGSRSQITPPRSQVNWITSVSVSPSSLCHRCRNGVAAPTKGIDGRSKRQSGTRVLPRRRFDMSGRDRGSPSCMKEMTARVSEKREGAEAKKKKKKKKKERQNARVTTERIVQEEENIERWKSSKWDLRVSARLINPGAVWRKWQQRSRSLDNILLLVSATAARV